MLKWLKPMTVPHFGLVYVSQCRRFMIVGRVGENYILTYTSLEHKYIHVGPFSRLGLAKKAAEEQKALCG
jgi:hypothetical protein